MNKDIQNLFISEYLGIHRVLYGKGRWSPSSEETNLIIGIDKNERRCDHFCYETSGYQCDVQYDRPKNYAGSLDAMHEAETALKNADKDQWHNYWYNLTQICEPSKEYWRATAAQRAEAFLKTVGKWKE